MKVITKETLSIIIDSALNVRGGLQAFKDFSYESLDEQSEVGIDVTRAKQVMYDLNRITNMMDSIINVEG